MSQEDVQHIVEAAATPMSKLTAGNVLAVWIVTLFAKFGVTSWSEAAGAIAFFYTLCLLMAWWWKILWRPLLVRMGWIDAPRDRRRSDRPAHKQAGQARPRMLVAVLALSGAGLVSITGYESYTSRAVIPVPGDAPTVGFGATGPDVRLGTTTTPPKAIARLLRDASTDEAAIKRCVHVPLAQGEYDAYVSLAYNIGPGAFCRSSLVRKLNAGDYAGACAGISAWDKFNGQPLPGLTARRAGERAMCEGRT